jgi:hypothetical protein
MRRKENQVMCTTENYMLDLGRLVAEKAQEAKQLRDNARGSDSYDYQVGFLMAYHEIVSLMQQQADLFGVCREGIGLDKLDPEADLV